MRRPARLAALILAALVLCGCGSSTTALDAPVRVSGPPTTAATIRGGMLVVPYTSPPTFTGQHGRPGSCHARGQLPDPICTPGSVGSTDQAEVCAPEFSDRHRPKPGYAATKFKRAAMAAYGIPDTEAGTTEADHLIPEWAGGSNDVSNVWAQRSDIPDAGWRNSKDSVETRVWNAVCKRGTATLADAQAAFAADWTTAAAIPGVG
ncbi:MAG TPA: hypothetical protein VFY38_14650 [Pseudonocardia sp.]|nr:hypothetical protein [Pseudonocardia sp.]